MNEEWWKRMFAAIVVVILLMVFVFVGSVFYFGYEQYQAKSDIENAINVPDGYSIEPVNMLNLKKMDGNWYRWIMWFKKPNYVCTEDEMINEPWKCEDITYDWQSATVWYNTKTKKMYQDSGSVDVL